MRSRACKQVLIARPRVQSLQKHTTAHARAQESLFLLLLRHWETYTKPMRVHTCLLYVHLPFKMKSRASSCHTLRYGLCCRHPWRHYNHGLGIDMKLSYESTSTFSRDFEGQHRRHSAVLIPPVEDTSRSQCTLL